MNQQQQQRSDYEISESGVERGDTGDEDLLLDEGLLMNIAEVSNGLHGHYDEGNFNANNDGGNLN